VSVWGAIRALGADRIGHGVRSVEDPGLLEYLVEHAIPLEVSMTSNVLLGVSPSIEDPQIRPLLDAGVTVTLNTDDPAYFSTDLTNELQLAHDVHGLSVDQLRQMQRDALAASFAPDHLKRTVAGELG
jgi:adenosine deaminase